MLRAVGRPEVGVLVACVVLTLGHLAFRHLVAGSGRQSLSVSALLPGAELRLGLPGQGVVPGACRLVVSFSPDCPACRRAAARERRADRAGRFAHASWVTNERTASLDPFAALLRTGSEVTVSRDLYGALRVAAVPGLYLVDHQDRLRWVGPYRGDETDALLEERCSRELPEPGGFE